MKVRETGELPEPASGKKEYATLLQSICIALYANSCRYKIPRNQQKNKYKDKDNDDDWDDRAETSTNTTETAKILTDTCDDCFQSF